ncbi:MAG: 4Fe-4S binding protein [Anaerolineae bacterium]|nr:4Fe-4S binding protein [Anaerolineae bacterium]
MAKGSISIDQERCKGCMLCTVYCPQHVLALSFDVINAKGYHPAALIDPTGKCTGCAICAVTCPDVCITVFRESRLHRKEREVAGAVHEP